MKKLNEIIERMPINATLSISTVGRHLGRTQKYEAKYRENGKLPFVYMADTPQEAIEKLYHKINSPECNIGKCCCHCNCGCCK